MVDFSDVRVELTVDEGWTDIVAGHFDAGVRLGESLEKDMIAESSFSSTLERCAPHLLPIV
ncbi:hypothetical protein SAMN02927900_01528 [Rhizobium mongolense subsp. loessense]|uniref:LysR substrate binding domain-containing protein n=1 Tax=Rhizobium mongolense subsp. loessense TaxID=158890 RepID=A0A1G4QA78_9HYPH|nr:hypothetical protein SAMN02927900_01528 [Rhizobium mongolense subsp. loessense]